MTSNPYNAPMLDAGSALTSGEQGSSGTNVVDVCSIGLCLLPLLSYAYVWVFWLVASMSVGHWVEPHLDDPKGFFFGVPHFLEVILMLLSFAVAPGIVLIGNVRRKLGVYVTIYGISLMLSILLYRLNVLGITDWISD